LNGREEHFRFVGNPRNDMPKGLFRLADYLEVIDWTGRQIREDKRGVIDDALPHILNRIIELNQEQWLYLTQNFESNFKTLVDAVSSLKKVCSNLCYQRLPGRSACEALY